MPENKDYTAFTLEELLKEEKKARKNEILSAVAAGFLIGIMVFGIVKNGFGFIYIFIPLLLLFFISRNSQNLKRDLKQIREAISAKK